MTPSMRHVSQAPGSSHACLLTLLRSWGLDPDDQAQPRELRELLRGSGGEGVDGSGSDDSGGRGWPCTLAPHAANATAALQHALDGVPCTVDESHADDVVAAIDEWRSRRGADLSGGALDGLDMLCDARWDAFPKPRVCMKSGALAPGTDVVDEAACAIVDSFSDVVRSGASAGAGADMGANAGAGHDGSGGGSDGGDGAQRPAPALNLQMFHRAEDDTGNVPTLPALLRWPLARELHGVDGGEDGDDTLHSSSVEGGAAPKGGAPARPWQQLGTRSTALSAFCDMATRVSAAGAVTWWHLDDGGEVTFQVGLPLSPKRFERPNVLGDAAGEGAGTHGPPVLLGPGGKPVVKLFIFARLEDYGLVTQDAETYRSARFAAVHPFRARLQDAPRRCRPHWTIVLLEAGGRPLLSPPNVQHIVLTLQTCAMVEMRRVLPLLLDEVLYFLERAAEWAEPPILYPVITETLQDEERTAEMMRALVAVLEGSSMLDLRRRAYHALSALEAGAAKGLFGGATEQLIGEARAAKRAAVEREEAVAQPDERARFQMRALAALAHERLGVMPLAGGGACAYAHLDDGMPLWGPVRESIDEAGRDRRAMASARKRGQLRELVRQYRAAEDAGAAPELVAGAGAGT